MSKCKILKSFFFIGYCSAWCLRLKSVVLCKHSDYIKDILLVLKQHTNLVRICNRLNRARTQEHNNTNRMCVIFLWSINIRIKILLKTKLFGNSQTVYYLSISVYFFLFVLCSIFMLKQTHFIFNKIYTQNMTIFHTNRKIVKLWKKNLTQQI